MGFLTRHLIPRPVRRVAHPVRAVRRAVTPKPIKRVRRVMHPVLSAKYAAERSIWTTLFGKRPKRSRRVVYRHGNCPVKHRTPETAATCRSP